MVRKVRLAIQKEIAETKRIVKKYEKQPTKKAFELSEAIILLRRLYGFLQEIVYKSVDYIRNVWVNVSQGKKISDLL